MTGKPSRSPSAVTLVLTSFALTTAALAGPHWLRDHAVPRPVALAASPSH